MEDEEELYTNVKGGREVEQPLLSDRQHTGKFVYFLTFFAAVGGFLFGYDTGVVSGALILLTKHFHLSFFMEELVVSITIAGAILGALFAAPLSQCYGRRFVLISASLVFTAGAILMALAHSTGTLLSGRAVVGLGIGLASMTVPVYIAESAPTHLRGKLVTLNNIFITGGQFVASVVDGVFCYDKINGWRYMLGLSGVPSLIMLFGLLFMPESPRWLVSQNKIEKARNVLSKIRDSPNVETELETIVKVVDQERTEYLRSSSGASIFKRVWRTPAVRWAVFIGCGLQAFQQLSGINTVMYYSSTIIKMAGTKTDEDAIWLAVPVAFTNFAFSLVALFLVERYGRRKLLLASLAGVIFSLLLLCIAFLLEMKSSPDVTIHHITDNITTKYGCLNYNYCYSCIEDQHCGFCYTEGLNGDILNGSCLPVVSSYQTDYSEIGRCQVNSTIDSSFVYDHCPFNLSWLAVLGLVLYLAWFAPGMGAMPWTVNSEIYPQWARSFGNGCSTTTNWLCNLLVSMTFLHLTRWLTKSGTFGLYTGISFLGWLFIYSYVPETKGKTLEEVTKIFDSRKVTI